MEEKKSLAMEDIDARLEKEIELVENDHTLSPEQKKFHIDALLRAAKDLRQDSIREANRLDKD